MKTKLNINLNRVYISLLMALPIIDNYRLLPVPCIHVFCVLGIAFALISHKNTGLGLRPNYIIYFIYIIATASIAVALQPATGILLLAKRLTSFVLIFFNFYIFAYRIWDFDFAVKIYKNICLVVSVLIIIQFLLSSIGRPVPLIPPGLVANTGDRVSTNVFRAEQIETNRFSTFFLEPAHQAQYVLPCIAILLFSDMHMRNAKKSELIAAIILSVGTIATTSMQGILLCGFLWMLYLYELMKQRGAKKIWQLLCLVPLMIVVVIYFLQEPIIQNQFLKKTSSITNGVVSRDSSMYLRIFYGWDCFREFDLTHKLFGCGYSNSGDYLYNTGIGLQYTSQRHVGYMSGLSRMFCETGIVGVLLNFSITIFVIIKNMKKNKMVMALLITWFGIMLTSSNFDALASLIPLTFMMDATMKKDRQQSYLIEYA